jgi:hypothetical protein
MRPCPQRLAHRGLLGTYFYLWMRGCEPPLFERRWCGLPEVGRPRPFPVALRRGSGALHWGLTFERVSLWGTRDEELI